MIVESEAFLKSLSPGQRAECVHTFDSEERFNWHYVPRDRAGIAFKQMSSAQTRLALALVRRMTSAAGAVKVAAIRSLECVLRDIEQGSGPMRDPDHYSITIFGSPGPDALWGVRLEGHHISLNLTVQGDTIVAAGPQFLGANPGCVQAGTLSGTRVLRLEEEIGFALIHSLDERQMQLAVIGGVAPPDILSGVGRDAQVPQATGIVAREFSSAQRRLLHDLVQAHSAVQTAHVRRERNALLKNVDPSAMRFAWMGALKPGIGHYYRVQSPVLLLELDNTQNNANHVHTVWRDLQHDWGLDLLADHYKHEHL